MEDTVAFGIKKLRGPIARPEMYFGPTDNLKAHLTFIEGMSFGLPEQILGLRFHDWLIENRGAKSTAFGWKDIILNQLAETTLPDEAANLAAFLKILEDYLNDLEGL